MEIRIYNKEISSELIDEIKKFDIEGISSYLNDPFTFTTGLVFSGDRIVAAGLIRVINELKVTLRPDVSNINKAMALKLLLMEARKRLQCGEAIALITQGGNRYSSILKTHFNFYEDPGIFLRLERDI